MLTLLFALSFLDGRCFEKCTQDLHAGGKYAYKRKLCVCFDFIDPSETRISLPSYQQRQKAEPPTYDDRVWRSE